VCNGIVTRGSAAAFAFLVAGLLWSHLVVAHFQRLEGRAALGDGPGAIDYEYWSVSVPAKVSFAAIALCMIVSAIQVIRRRALCALPRLLLHGALLAAAHWWIFLSLEFKIFD
jgi:hypothetical protein